MKSQLLHKLNSEEWRLIEGQFSEFAGNTINFITENKGSLAEAKAVYAEAFLCYTQLLELYGYKLSEQADQIIYSFSRKLWIQKLGKRNVDVNFVKHRREYFEMEDAFHEIESIKERSEKTADKLATVGEPSRTMILEHVGKRRELMSVAPRLGFDNEDKAFAHIAKSLRKLIKLTEGKDFDMQPGEFESLVRYVMDNADSEPTQFSDQKKVCITMIARAVAMVRNYVVRGQRLDRFKELQNRTELSCSVSSERNSAPTSPKKMKPIALFLLTALIAIVISGITAFGLSNALDPRQTDMISEDVLVSDTTDVFEIDIVKVKPTKPATAFAIAGPGMYITTAFAVMGKDSVVLVNHKIENQIKAAVMMVDTLHGIALLKSGDEVSGKIPFRCSPDAPKIGEAIFTVGFPRDELYFSEGVLNTITMNESGFAGLQLSSPGAPLMSDKGQIVGMITDCDGASPKDQNFLQIGTIKMLIEQWADENAEILLLPNRNALYYDNRPAQIEKMAPFVFQVKNI